ncbi:MAG: iron-containing alcohol dehydrogenase family protein [Eubacteriales bacterium]|nr:iron-containing alcohol dehydrogenase family protein [Eubacteriales bacterium]
MKHAMETYSLVLPAYTIGNGDAYRGIGPVCGAYGKRAALIGGEKALLAAEDRIRAYAGGLLIPAAIPFGGECSEEAIDALCAAEDVQNADMLFAAGGGKALDTVKAVGEKLQKPVFAFPTIASNCAACTSVSILYHADGSFLRPYFLKRPPVHTFIELEILAAAPERYFWAGMGDTYAKYFESTVSSRGEKLPHYEALGVTISRMCLKPILEDGAEAYRDHRNGRASAQFRETVLAIIVTTALASIFLTKDRIIDYNTGLAHAIFYALTSWPQIEREHLHGEVVGFGVLVLLLADGQEEMFRKLYAFHRQVGLPVSLSELGIKKEELPRVIRQTIVMKDIEHNPYEITAELLEEAFEKLEAYEGRTV